MKQKCGRGKGLAEKVVKDIRQATWRQVLSEEKIRIVLAGLRGEDSIAELYRREGVTESLHYSGTRISWRRARSATGEVKGLCR